MNKKLIGAVLATLAFGSVAVTTQAVEASDEHKTHEEAENTKTNPAKDENGSSGEKMNDKNMGDEGKKTSDDEKQGGEKPCGCAKACGCAKGCGGMKTDKN